MSLTSEHPGFYQRMVRMLDRRLLRAAIDLLVVGICTLAFALNAAGICATLLTDNYAGARDFMTYWAAGHELVHHASPYDSVAVAALERSIGYPASLPTLIMRNAPLSLPLVLPLGFLGIRAASLLWSSLMVGALLISVRMLAAMNGRQKTPLNILGYTFAPALSCLISGQMALFVLLGLVLFLRLHQARPFLAGVSLWLCALKPHLFLPFGLVLLIWIVGTRRYSVLLGALSALVGSTLIAVSLDRSVWTHYLEMMKSARIDQQVVPCMSVLLRFLVSPSHTWVQCLPAGLGCLWALIWFRRHRRDWDWMEHGALLMLASVAVAPYSWFMDQAVLLPALLFAVYRTDSRSLIAVFALLSAAIEIANFRGVPLGSLTLYPWTACAWLLWYLFAIRGVSSVSAHGLRDDVTIAPETA